MAGNDHLEINTADVWPEDTDENEGVVSNWFTSEGSQVEEGDTLCEIQVEKVSVDVPAPAAGTVHEIVCAEDDEFERGDILAVLEAA
ncbi:lipoyl-binding domain protein (plasmid) [Natrialba magadii ATCC 43099]|uniref:Biotin/lipoyl attachment domain-containing protein n=1 Tax=Natrialba magadii (strain ATCC 43099 / DSM 3394 / CCM 3739 / CIP 104546 / IAM 13178 / JCM 8861 / NBRC 102185 / NCIMB 2190 / MS3) TaxID=547559 RepID=D3T1V1_NATMM|nr:lipoyl domain-containing protein [Natrialba magadii]ADD07560.1 lipoyl-binding domain protein [Natrialba magadii ATCC 43099]ELY27201.1 biotin/lipoyl attachment domain-containing protein [Natrialba magadii ATCC 43099]